MKEVTRSAEVKPLPPKHIAVLFEGPWLFTQDPDCKSRILAICPYTNAPDHECICGLWEPLTADTGRLIGPSGYGRPGLICEGDKYWVDVVGESDCPKPSTVSELFKEARKHYSFVYMDSTDDEVPLQINNGNPLMRRVSIAVPNWVRAAGCMTTAEVKAGDADKGKESSMKYLVGAEDAVFVHVTFIFIYSLTGDADLNLSSDRFVQTTLHTTDRPNPHLIFRVRSVMSAEEDGCPIDNTSDSCHVVGTFDLLRKMAIVPATAASRVEEAKGTEKPPGPGHIDIGAFPEPGKQKCQRGDSGLIEAELGLEPGPLIHVLTYASCAAGPLFAHSGDK